MVSRVIKRSVVVDQRKTSISMEETFWAALKELAKERGTLAALVSSIKAEREPNSNLSSAIRVYILRNVQKRLLSLQQSRAAHHDEKQAPVTPPVGHVP